MISGHGPNPIFFNEKLKIGRPEHSVTPDPIRPITSHFCVKVACRVRVAYLKE